MLLWVVVVGFLGIGSFFATQPGESVAKTAVIVQGGYPMWVNEAANESASRWEGIPLRIYQKLTQNAVPGDLTLWPEAPFGQRWGESLELEGVISKLVMERSIYLMGLIRTNGEGYLFNSAFVFDGEAIQFKDKQRLILHEEGDFSPGKNPALFDTSIGKLGAVFCFESVVPSYTRELVQGGAQVIAVLANGTKLGRTPVARLHAQRSVLRAVETGRWVLHSGHHGFSMIVSPQGITTTPTAPYESAVVSGIFYLTQGKTPYMILGDKPLYIWLLFFLGYLCLSLFLKGWASR